MLLEISKSPLHVGPRTDFGNGCWVLMSSASFNPWSIVLDFCTVSIALSCKRSPEVGAVAGSL